MQAKVFENKRKELRDELNKARFKPYIYIYIYIHTHTHTHVQAKVFEDKCKELRDELNEARDENERLNASLADMVSRAELLAARKVRALPNKKKTPHL